MRISEQYQNKGICNSCNNVSTCIYSLNSEKPVFECEELDDFISIPALKPIIENEKKTILNKTEKYRGLCSDCEKRTKCMYSDVDRGVLHCEEYTSSPLYYLG